MDYSKSRFIFRKKSQKSGQLQDRFMEGGKLTKHPGDTAISNREQKRWSYYGKNENGFLTASENLYL